MNKRKALGTIIGAIFWFICIVYFTYAYYEWKSINTNVVLGIQDLATKCIKGDDIKVSNIGPVFNYQDGVIAEFIIDNGISSSKIVPFVLNISSISNNLLVDYFKYVLVVDINGGSNYDYSIPVVTGDFDDFVVGNNNITSIVVDGNSTYSYQFIVYIDGNVKNDSNIQNNSLRGSLVLGDCGIVSSIPLTINNNSRLLSLETTTEEAFSSVVPQTISVTNTSEEDYSFDVVLRDSINEDAIDSQYVMTKVGYLESKSLADCTNNVIKEDVIVASGETVDIDVRVWLDSSAPASELDKGSTPKLSIDGLTPYNGSEDINNNGLSLTYMNTSSINDFRGDLYKTYIKNASFVDYIDTSNASINSETNEKITWDMSTARDGSVIVWLEDNEEEGYYNLYIGCNEYVYAESLKYFFNGMTALENISFNNLSTGLTLDMIGMFGGCGSLVQLDLTNFNTGNVVKMGDTAAGKNGMFSGCSSLVSLDLSSFDTSKVTNMAGLFSDCSSLVSLDVSSFNTSNVMYMGAQNDGWTWAGMFKGCSSLINLDLSNFDTSNVIGGLVSMFDGCNSLVSLDLSSFDTSKVNIFANMFRGCKSLTELDVSSFDTSKVTNMYGMFNGCKSLIVLDLGSFDTSNVVDMTGMFGGCNKLTELDVSSFDTSNVLYMGANSSGNTGMFSGCSSLTELNLNNFNTSKVTNMVGMFEDCSSLTELNLSNFDTSNVKYMGVDQSGWYWGGMFEGCIGLVSLNLSNFDFSNVISMNRMFNGCSSLENIIFTDKINGNNITLMSGMFNGCSSLVSLNLSNFDTSNVTSMANMFNGCSSLVSLNLSNFDTSELVNTYYMFYNCNKLTTTITISNSLVTNYSGMFINAATTDGAKITVNYVGDDTKTIDVNESTEALVEAMVATGGTNVVKGSLVT